MFAECSRVGSGGGAAAVRLADVTAKYGELVAVNRVTLEVRRGEFFSVLGPSGCGKTTTLRSIAGLTRIWSGTIELFGRDVTDLPPDKRNIGLVFQNYALFPHMTIAENIGFGLRMRRFPRSEIPQRVERILDLVGLAGTGKRYPNQISGGQQQRVALARALVIEPELLLLDEPLSNLDAKLRKSMQIELRALQQRVGITAMYVTHDQEEAMTLSDRIAVMNNGEISQLGTPVEIYRRPANRFVAQFIGRVNLLGGRLEPIGAETRLVLASGDCLDVPASLSNSAAKDGTVHVIVRPENVQISEAPGRSEHGPVAALIVQAVYTGPVTDYVLELTGGTRLIAEEQNTVGLPRHREGEKVSVYIDPGSIYPVPDGGT